MERFRSLSCEGFPAQASPIFLFCDSAGSGLHRERCHFSQTSVPIENFDGFGIDSPSVLNRYGSVNNGHCKSNASEAGSISTTSTLSETELISRLSPGGT